MSNILKNQGSLLPAQTLDLTASLGYGLVYQSILSTCSQSEPSIVSQFISLDRQYLHRPFFKMQRS